MDDWTITIIYGFIIYFIYKANSKIMMLKGSQIFERPSEWSWLTWKIYLIRNSIKPKSINIPFGMWLVVIYFGLGVIGYFVLKGIDLSGVVKSTIRASKLYNYQAFGIMILELVTIFLIFKKKLVGYYFSVLIVGLQILFTIMSYIFPLPNIEITISYIIKSLIFPVLILSYLIKKKEYFIPISS